jgi:hypothetical protein
LKTKEKIFLAVIVILFLCHLLLPIIEGDETHQVNYFIIIFAFIWGIASFLIAFIALKYLGFSNFSWKGAINSKVELNSTDMLIVKIAILLYVGGISYALIGIYFFDMR